MSRPNAFPGRIVFDHRPKTAGQSINRWLIARLGPGCVTPNLVGSHRDLIARYGGRYSVISGHVFYDDFESLDPRYRYLTVLRRPVDRALSWIGYLLSDVPETAATNELRAGARDFIASEGRRGSTAFLESVANPYVMHFCGVGGARAMPEAKRVACALDALRQYDLVGLYEDLPDFARRTAELIGGTDWPPLPRVNVGTGKPASGWATPSLRQRIADLTALDAALYESVSRAWPGNREPARPRAAWPVDVDWSPYAPKAQGKECLTTPDAIIGKARVRGSALIVQGTLATFDVDILLAREVGDLVLGIHFLDGQQALAFGTNTHLMRQALGRAGPGSYRVSYTVAMDFACGGYTVGFGIAERTGAGLVTLAWARQWLGFDVVPMGEPTFIGYTRLPTRIGLEASAEASPWGAVERPHGRILPASDAPARIAVAQPLSLALVVENDGAQVWAGDVFRPIRVTAGWHRVDTAAEPGGEQRVGDLVQPIEPQARATITVDIVPPAAPGSYILELSLVQEMVGRFQLLDGDFSSLRLPIEVDAR